MITLSIDVTLLDKTKFKHHTKKDGTKSIYCNLVLIEVTSDYGDYMVKQDSTKEQREQEQRDGIKTPILGNAKIRVKNQESKPAAATPKKTRDQELEGEDVPF